MRIFFTCLYQILSLSFYVDRFRYYRFFVLSHTTTTTTTIINKQTISPSTRGVQTFRQIPNSILPKSNNRLKIISIILTKNKSIRKNISRRISNDKNNSHNQIPLQSKTFSEILCNNLCFS